MRGAAIGSADRRPLRAAGGTMPDEQFRFLAALVHERTGIVIHPAKRQMLCSRLDKRLRALGLAGYAEYCRHLASDDGAAEIGELVNAITTNLTHFFREAHHFEHLVKQALPDVMARLEADGSRRLRIWSAGCSTGQEPYSLAMTLLSGAPGIAGWDARILATDIDSAVLDRAIDGCYPLERAEGLPETHRKRFTRRHRDGSVSIAAEPRDLIAFRQLNLLEDWPFRGPFQIVFCRNVVIYFDKPTQTALFDRMADYMADGGWLYIGHSESLFKVTERFRPVGGTIYRKVA